MRSASTVAVQESPFQLRGSTFTMMVLKVIAPEDPSFQSLLLNKIRQAPNFFRNAPVVLDLDDLHASPDFDLIDFVVQLRSMNLIAVGIQGGTPDFQRLAVESGLPVMPSGRAAARGVEAADEAADPHNRFGLAPGRAPTDPMPPKAPPRASVAAEPPPTEAPQRSRATTMVVSEPVRSGRQIYAPGGDLIVLGPVSPGAELLADGNIHVYAPLRGRALAGLSGDPSARIFCQSLEAELVSIAGLYRINEDLDQQFLRKPVQIWLDEGYLRVDPL